MAERMGNKELVTRDPVPIRPHHFHVLWRFANKANGAKTWPWDEREGVDRPTTRRYSYKLAHSLREDSADDLSYYNDLFGETFDEQAASVERFREAFEAYYSLSASDILCVSTAPDVVCNSCHVGEHCTPSVSEYYEYTDRMFMFHISDWIGVTDHLQEMGYPENAEKFSVEFNMHVHNFLSVRGELNLRREEGEGDPDVIALEAPVGTLVDPRFRVFLNGAYVDYYADEWKPVLSENGVEYKTMFDLNGYLYDKKNVLLDPRRNGFA